jgi:probable DNA repair protein
LKDQALCPFRAFAHYRLRGHEFEQAQPGLDAMTRGDLLHRSLEHFWSDVREQRQLLALDADERAARIERHIATALEEFFAGQVQPPPALLQLEQARLQGLVQEWLTVVEADREPFAVLELEQEHYEQIGPLQIRTVVDRIDQLPDGSRVILDYKTGLVSADGLLGARLLEPQLPIYAVAAAGSEADAVAFAQVRRGACKLVGIAREDGLLPRVPGVAASKALQELGLENWSQLRDHWRRQLEQLAADYVNGEASVNPVSYEKACQFCDLAGLCRIAEARYETAAGEVSA